MLYYVKCNGRGNLGIISEKICTKESKGGGTQPILKLLKWQMGFKFPWASAGWSFSIKAFKTKNLYCNCVFVLCLKR